MHSDTQLQSLMVEFHQDWDEVFSIWEELVDHWSAHRSRAEVRAAISQLDELITSKASEQELDRTLASMHCMYYAVDDPGVRIWLTAIRRRLMATQE